MLNSTLALINSALTDGGINYAFSRFNGEVKFPYWTGTFTEYGPGTENHMQEDSLYLNGYTVGGWTELLEDKEKIRDILEHSYHKNVAFKLAASPILDEDQEAELKTMELKFSVYEWRAK